MSYYYYLKISANVPPNLAPKLLSFKQEIVNLNEKRSKYDCKYFVNY